MNIMDLRTIIITFELFVLLLLAFIGDIKSNKVRNTLTLTFILLGIISNLIFRGFGGFFLSFLGILLPFMIFLPLYILKMLGAGDIKLFSAIGAICGYRFLLRSMIYSFLTGGIIALIVILIQKNSKQRLSHLIHYILNCFLTSSIQPYCSNYYSDCDIAITLNSNADIQVNKAMFPFACAISLGTVLAWQFR